MCLTMGDMNARVSPGPYSTLCGCYSHRQPHLRQHVLFFCRLNKFTSPVLTSWSIIRNSVLQSPTMRFKSTSIINLEFRYLCINKHCELKNKTDHVPFLYSPHFLSSISLFFRKKKIKNLYSTKVLKYYPIYTSSKQLLGMG